MKNKSISLLNLSLFIILNLIFLTNFVSAQCVINITNGSLGHRLLYTQYENCTINVTSKLELVGKITFKNCIFNMGANAEINMHKPIKSGSVLYRNRVTFENCILDASGTNDWSGINVATGSYLTTISSTRIKHALNGINGAFQSNCHISETTFNFCRVGINFPNLDNRFDSGTSGFINLSGFSGNKFSNCDIGIKLKGVAYPVNIGLNAQIVNEFALENTGIYIENSSVNISNCKFSNNDIHIDIVNNLTDNKNNVRNCIIKGLGNSITAFNFAYDRSIRVRGNWQTVGISNAKFVNLGHVNAIDIENINNGDFNISNNTFLYNEISGLYGAIISVKNSSGLNFPRISNNTFLEPFGGGYSFSIQLVNLKPIRLDVSGNKLYGSDIFDLNQNKIGEQPSQKTFCSFHAENCVNVQFRSNVLNLASNASPNTPWIMHHMTGNSCTFESNIVSNVSTTNRQSIRLEGLVEDDILCNNSLYNSFKGILIVNNAPGTKIQSNTIVGNGAINNDQIGLEVNGNIPTQKHEGNKWEGGKFQYEAFLNARLTINLLQNTFLSRNDNYNLSDKYWPTLINKSNWFADDKTVNYPNNCAIRPIPSSCIDYNDNRYLSDTIFRSSLSQGELWDNDSYFYRYYSKFPSCLIYNDQIDLYSALNNSNFSDYQFIQNGIDNFYKIDSNTEKYIDNQTNLIDSLFLDLSILYNGINSEDTIEVDSTYQMNINNLEEILKTLTNEMDSTLRGIDSLRFIEIDYLYSSLENIDSYNSFDSLYKVYYYLALKYISNDTFTEQEYEFLYNLSRLCPSTFGNIPYKANAMLEQEDHLESLNENCVEPILLNEGNSSNSNAACEISIFPNPIMANNDLILNSKCAMNSCKIYDIFGKVLLIRNYDKVNSISTNKLKLSELNLIPGVYIVVINLKNGSTTQRRISVN